MADDFELSARAKIAALEIAMVAVMQQVNKLSPPAGTEILKHLQVYELEAQKKQNPFAAGAFRALIAAFHTPLILDRSTPHLRPVEDPPNQE